MAKQETERISGIEQPELRDARHGGIGLHGLERLGGFGFVVRLELGDTEEDSGFIRVRELALADASLQHRDGLRRVARCQVTRADLDVVIAGRRRLRLGFVLRL